MADWTKEQLSNEVLQHLGVLGTGQAASGEDGAKTLAAIDSAHAQLRLQGRAPFLVDAIPDWAQDPMRDYVAGALAISFGLSGERLAEIQSAKETAKRTLDEQTAAAPQDLPVRRDWF